MYDTGQVKFNNLVTLYVYVNINLPELHNISTPTKYEAHGNS